MKRPNIGNEQWKKMITTMNPKVVFQVLHLLSYIVMQFFPHSKNLPSSLSKVGKRIA